MTCPTRSCSWNWSTSASTHRRPCLRAENRRPGRERRAHRARRADRASRPRRIRALRDLVQPTHLDLEHVPLQLDADAREVEHDLAIEMLEEPVRHRVPPDLRPEAEGLLQLDRSFLRLTRPSDEPSGVPSEARSTVVGSMPSVGSRQDSTVRRDPPPRRWTTPGLPSC